LEEALFFGETPQGLYIKALGHITAGLCSDLKSQIFTRLDKLDLPKPEEMVMDLSACDYMDSTFMGLIVGFNKKFKQLTGKKLEILNPSKECMKLLTSLGIVKLLDISSDSDKIFPQNLEKLSKGEKPTAELLLKAHENLSEISLENEKKFSVLQDILKKQLNSGT